MNLRRANLALLIVSATVVALLVAPAPALAERPNIQRVVVSQDGEGHLVFRVVLARPVILDLDDTIQVAIDADRDRGTGINGLEYSLDWTGYSAALLRAVNGKQVESRPSTLRFTSTGNPRPFAFATATFSIAAAAIRNPERFDFYVFVKRDGDIDEAPSHVLVSGDAAPWTFPRATKLSPGEPHAPEVYEDGSDFNLSERRTEFLGVIAAAVVGLGGTLGLIGWGGTRLRERRTFRRKNDAAPG
jgi:hypothetical protein